MNFDPKYVTIHWRDFEASLARAFAEITPVEFNLYFNFNLYYNFPKLI